MEEETTKVNSRAFKPLVLKSAEFDKLYNLPIGEFVEQKGGSGFNPSYLSWAHARRLLHENKPNWFVDFELTQNGELCHPQPSGYCLMPFMTDGEARTPCTPFPIMDHRFKAIAQPDACAVNKNIQRAKAKCIAEYSGIGLKLFVGEDIPRGDIEEKVVKQTPSATPAENPSTNWQAIPCPSGKHKGTLLGEFTEKQLEWWLNNYKGADESFKAGLLAWNEQRSATVETKLEDPF